MKNTYNIILFLNIKILRTLQRNQETKQQMYKKGEVVWAKLKGFPWWPATVIFLFL